MLKIKKNLFKPVKNLQKTFWLLSQSHWAIVSIDEGLRSIYRRFFWLLKKVFGIWKLTEKIYKKFTTKYSKLNAHLVKYRKVKKQFGVRCVYCFDVEEREKKIYTVSWRYSSICYLKLIENIEGDQS